MTATKMKEKPFLFSAPMVKAILSGAKTQTRRIMNPQPEYFEQFPHWRWKANGDKLGPWAIDSGDRPGIFGKYVPGERLWVKETFAHTTDYEGHVLLRHDRKAIYRADDDLVVHKWRPSTTMPRWASRITLEITDVRIERLHELSEEDAIAEGITRSERTEKYLPGACDYATWAFRELWESINGKGSWDANPWLWVIHFRRLEQ